MKNFNLNDLDVNNIGAWPWPIKMVLIVIVCIATQAAGYKLVLEAQQNQLADAIRKEQKMRKELAGKSHKVVHLDRYKKKLENMNRSFGAMLRQLPDKNEVAELLVDISQSGLASGLEFELFKPKPELKKGFYAELPIKIEVTGNYHEFGRFISEIAGLSRIVTVHDFKIQIDGKQPDRLMMQSTAKTYRYLDENELERPKKKVGSKAAKKG